MSGAPRIRGIKHRIRGSRIVILRGLRLEGMREMTSVVLEMKWVDLVCTSALHRPLMFYIYTHRTSPPSRVSRECTLHGLDQHGISFNTLYARCEPQGTTTAHLRVTLVDAGDPVSGVWVGYG